MLPRSRARGSDASTELPPHRCNSHLRPAPTCPGQSPWPPAGPGGRHGWRSLCQGSLQPLERQPGFGEQRRNPLGRPLEATFPGSALPAPTPHFFACVSATGVQDDEIRE